MNRLLGVLFTALVVSAVVLAISVRSYLGSPMPALEEPMVYVVEPGSSLGRVARDLQTAGILSRPRIFVTWGRFTGQAASIKAGEYEIRPGTTPAGLLDQLVAGDVKLYPFTILEGWTVRDVWQEIDRNPAVIYTLRDQSSAARTAALGLDIKHLEGQFFPDTYMVPRGTTDIALLGQAAELMQEQLREAWEQRAVGLPYESPYELLTLASIVERETALDIERPQVAGVFVRRLQKGMRLQTDPTVIYGLGESYDGNITRKDLLTDTPYNTYTRGGLPPTPIGMPGSASLQAAAQPDDGDALYFVASGDPDGSHVFSRTLEEHNAAVAAYIATLRQQRRERERAGQGGE